MMARSSARKSASFRPGQISATFAEAMQDAGEQSGVGRSGQQFSDVAGEVRLRLDIGAEPSRRLLAQWPCYASEKDAAHSRQLAQPRPAGKMYLFSDSLLYALAATGGGGGGGKPFEMQSLLPLYRLHVRFKLLPSKTWRLRLSWSSVHRPLIVYTTDEQAAKSLPAAVAHEHSLPADTQQEIVRVSIADSPALVPLGLSRAHKAIAVSRQTTAKQMRKEVLQKMCTNLSLPHIQSIMLECEDFRIWRVSQTRGEEAAFDADDCPLRYLSIDPDWALVMKPWPPRRNSDSGRFDDSSSSLSSSSSSSSSSGASKQGSWTGASKSELGGDEETWGVIRVFFCDTPLLHSLDIGAGTFKTMFISSKLTTGEVHKILIGKITDSIASSSERKSIRSQLAEHYRLWGSSADNRRMLLDPSSHPWPVFMKACQMDPQFRLVYAPSAVSSSSSSPSALSSLASSSTIVVPSSSSSPAPTPSSSPPPSSSPLISLAQLPSSSSSSPSISFSSPPSSPPHMSSSASSSASASSSSSSSSSPPPPRVKRRTAAEGRHRPWRHKVLGSKKSRIASPLPSSRTMSLWSADETAASLHVEREICASSRLGRVLLARHAASGKALAIVELQAGKTSAAEQSAIEAEVAATLQQCRHPDIVSYYGCCRRGGTGGDLWLVVDYCAHGSLRRLLATLPGGCLSEHEAVAVLVPVLRGLDYLHGHGVAHGDLHCGHVLFTGQGEVKLAGYGLAKASPAWPTAIYNGTSNTLPALASRPQTLAPEAVDARCSAGSSAADVWSLGVAVIEMLDGQQPHSDASPRRTLYMILYSEPPQLAPTPARSVEAASFVSACLQKEPAKRPTAAELLSHPLLDPRSAIMEVISTAATSRQTPYAPRAAAASPSDGRLPSLELGVLYESPRGSPWTTAEQQDDTSSDSFRSVAADSALHLSVEPSLQDIESTIDHMISHRFVSDRADAARHDDFQLWGTPELNLASGLLELEEEIAENTDRLPPEQEVLSDAPVLADSSAVDAHAIEGYQQIEVIAHHSNDFLEEII